MFKKTAKYVIACVCAALVLSVGVSANDSLSVADYLTAPDWATGESAVIADASALNLGGKSIILMEESTGRVLYERDADLQMPPPAYTNGVPFHH